MRTPTVLFLIGLLLPGCAGPSRLAETPATLEEVNRALAGRTASIRLVDGRRIGNLRMVRVEPDTTYYRSYSANRSTEHVATADIAEIRYRVDSGARDGFLIGILPGIALGIVGLIGIDGESSGAGIVGYTAVVGGAVLALVGGLVGVIVGNNFGKQEVVVYEHPVSSYLGN